MRSLALAIAVFASSVVAAEPSKDRPIDDAAGVIDAADEHRLTAELIAMRDTVDIAVILVRSTGGESIEAYARRAGQRWSSGTTAAAVIVLAITDRKSRLEVSDGLRPRFPDHRAKSILDNSRGYLRAGDYAGAIRAIANDVKSGAAGNAPDLESPHPQSTDPTVPSQTRPVVTYEVEEKRADRGWIWIVVVIGGLIVFFGAVWGISNRKATATLSHAGSMHQRPAWADVLWGIVKVLGILLYVVMIIAAASGSSSSSSSSSSWGGGGGGSSSGGSGGGGGWSGGGASSSW